MPYLLFNPKTIFNLLSSLDCNSFDRLPNFPTIIFLSTVAIFLILKTESFLSPVDEKSLSPLVKIKSVSSRYNGITEEIKATQTSFLLFLEIINAGLNFSEVKSVNGNFTSTIIPFSIFRLNHLMYIHLHLYFLESLRILAFLEDSSSLVMVN